MPCRILLVDGDILIYKAAAAHQTDIKWDDDSITSAVDDEAAKVYCLDKLNEYKEALQTDTIFIALSDCRNFRKEDITGSYKANRSKLARPLLLPLMREHIASLGDVLCWPRLEADDVLGICATGSTMGWMPGAEVIIVSQDKDLKTIPGKLWNPGHPELGIQEATPEEAFYTHMMQSLTGDTTDGYRGCPGIGPKKAEAILAASDGTPQDMWRMVVGAYEAATIKVDGKKVNAGLTERDALETARLAYILHAGDYNRNTCEVTLWEPPR